MAKAIKPVTIFVVFLVISGIVKCTRQKRRIENVLKNTEATWVSASARLGYIRCSVIGDAVRTRAARKVENAVQRPGTEAAAEIEVGEPGCAIDSRGDVDRLCVKQPPLCDCYCRLIKRAVGGGRCVGHITENLGCVCYMCNTTNASDSYKL
ncbi:hypothetical protein YC2023_036777 [Brassica napus]|uniref:(rape) hypothetical protein n=1 Tax=Brassica napus TaxID=3708 RepID=A0A816ICX8_BRANA|nr:unnamed protein product [Brassica napus]